MVAGRQMAARFDYSRFDYGRRVQKDVIAERKSLVDNGSRWLLCSLRWLPAAAQYPGQITNADKNTPTLRAVAVFEWTGDEAHPKTSRLVPICIYDGQELQDADIYLARPYPLALSSDVEYQLLQDGKPLGLFDIETAAREQGSWVGYGKHLPLPAAKPAPAQVAKIDEYDDSQSDTPILHRKHHAGDASSGSGGILPAAHRAIRPLTPMRRLPIPTVPRCTRAATLQPAARVTARIRIPAAAPPAPIPRNRPIPAVPRCIAAATPPAPAAGDTSNSGSTSGSTQSSNSGSGSNSGIGFQSAPTPPLAR